VLVFALFFGGKFNCGGEEFNCGTREISWGFLGGKGVRIWNGGRKLEKDNKL
jgi:hypothetical protein